MTASTAAPAPATTIDPLESNYSPISSVQQEEEQEQLHGTTTTMSDADYDEPLPIMDEFGNSTDFGSHLLIPRIAECILDNHPLPPSLLDLIYSKRWNELREVIHTHPETVYQVFGRNNRLVIHELCKIATYPITVETKGEVSDDDDDDDDETAEAVESLKLTNEQISAVIKDMIEASHRLGPFKVVMPADDNESENEMDHLQQRRRQQRHQQEQQAFIGHPDHERNQAEEIPFGFHELARGVSINERYEIHESILTVGDKFGKTPLHVLCENSADTSIMNVILSHTLSSENDIHQGQDILLPAPTALSLITAKDLNGSTPLHYLSYSRVCPFSSIKLMMDYAKPDPNSSSPDPTLCSDMDGDTPLHWALDGYMSPRRIKQLLRYSKAALWVRNKQGRRPMDQFVDNFVDSDWYLHELCGREVWENIQGYLKVMTESSSDTQESASSTTTSTITGTEEKLPSTEEASKQVESTMKRLASQQEEEKKAGDFLSDGEGYATAQAQTEKDNWLPVHNIAGSTIDFPPIFLDIALHYNQDDLLKKDEHGNLPLHLACARTNVLHPETVCDGTVAKKILAKCPQAAYVATRKRKRLPIHIAVESQKPLNLVSSLIKAYPNSLNAQDPVTSLWLFLLAGSSYPDSLDVSYSLLRADPSIMHLCLDKVLRKRARKA